MASFEHINRGFNDVFQPNRLSLGLVVPIENYPVGALASMQAQTERIQLAESLGFKSVWLRDIPFHVPAFGDAGQMYDPFTYLGFLAASTRKIALGVSSIALPLHHPVHVAKSAASVDVLSGGRLILGVASGDRPNEYPYMGIDFEERGERFKEAFQYIRSAQEHFPSIETNHFGSTDGSSDIVPKASGNKIPMLMTGYSQQSMEWNAEHADGWMYYPRDVQGQKFVIHRWRLLVEQFGHDKPFMQPLYLDLHKDPDFAPQPIRLGMRTGVNGLNEFLQNLNEIGVNHVAFNLRFNQMNMEETLHILSEQTLSHFH